jgi:hypothetical protein
MEQRGLQVRATARGSDDVGRRSVLARSVWFHQVISRRLLHE